MIAAARQDLDVCASSHQDALGEGVITAQDPPSGGHELAEWLMATADRICSNGELTVIELQAFLPEHPFTRWFMRRPRNMVYYDQVYPRSRSACLIERCPCPEALDCRPKAYRSADWLTLCFTGRRRYNLD